MIHPCQPAQRVILSLMKVAVFSAPYRSTLILTVNNANNVTGIENSTSSTGNASTSIIPTILTSMLKTSSLMEISKI